MQHARFPAGAARVRLLLALACKPLAWQTSRSILHAHPTRVRERPPQARIVSPPHVQDMCSEVWLEAGDTSLPI